MTNLTTEFVHLSRQYLRGDYLPRILVCLDTLSDEDVWWRMNEASNSIGNLVLHLCGNARQWIVAGVGGAKDTRTRQHEFDQRAVIPRSDLVARLRATLDDVDAALAAVDPGKLLEPRRIQGLDTTVMGAIYHVVEHFSTHTGQIVMLTKQRTGRDLGFWEARADGTVTRRWQAL